jgi:hypothetical protein
MTRSAARIAAPRWTATGCAALPAWLILAAMQRAPSRAIASSPPHPLTEATDAFH